MNALLFKFRKYHPKQFKLAYSKEKKSQFFVLIIKSGINNIQKNRLNQESTNIE
jgi:hypothetical protein